MIKMTLTEDKRFIVLTSLKNISFSILKEFTNYTDKTGLSNGNSVFIYEIPVYTTNCFVFKYLLLKFTDKFECDDLLKQAIFSEADKVQNPTASILGTEYIGIKCPQIDSYNRLMGMLGGTLAMMNLWKIRFSRLYSSIRVILNWKHIFLPSIQIDDKLKKDINFNNLSGNGLSEINYLDQKTTSITITNLMVKNYDLYCKLVKDKCEFLLNDLKKKILKDYNYIWKKIGNNDERQYHYFIDKILYQYKMKFLNVKEIYFKFLTDEERSSVDVSWLFNK